MALLVHKYGGTSLGSVERIASVADNIILAREQNHQVVVVVSAMAGETNRLLQMAQSFQVQPNPRELAALLTTGEQVSMTLLAIALEKRGYTARSYTGQQVGILTDASHDNAAILDVDVSRLRDNLGNNCIPIVAGFQGCDEVGDVTTFGRGGSDFTATLLAAHLQADECQIFSDVDGIYTADPNLVNNARCLATIPFSAMLELSRQGARVMQCRALEVASKQKVPIRVLSSFNQSPGTLIIYDYQSQSNEHPIIGISHLDDQAMFKLDGIQFSETEQQQLQHMCEDIDGEISYLSANPPNTINKLLGKNNAQPITIIIPSKHYRELCRYFSQHPLWQQAKTTAMDNLVKISLVGIGINHNSDVYSTIAESLQQAGISAQLFDSKENRISVLIDEKALEESLVLLHRAVGLESAA